MLQNVKKLYGTQLSAPDGEIGHIKDFYFDDRDWVVRYVVSDTGSWLTERQVLLSPFAFGAFNSAGKHLRVDLTRKQIENSPAIESYEPISRQFEEEYRRYYGWPGYWQHGGSRDSISPPNLGVPPITLSGKPFLGNGSLHKRADEHLQSTLNVNGYRLEARDGKIGHVCDFMMDSESWAISRLVIKTGSTPGREVEIPTTKVDRILYDKSTVFVNLTGKIVERSPLHHLVPSGVAN